MWTVKVYNWPFSPEVDRNNRPYLECGGIQEEASTVLPKQQTAAVFPIFLTSRLCHYSLGEKWFANNYPLSPTQTVLAFKKNIFKKPVLQKETARLVISVTFGFLSNYHWRQLGNWVVERRKSDSIMAAGKFMSVQQGVIVLSISLWWSRFGAF